MTRTALVVGGTRGIGKEIARQLAQSGYDVTIVGRPSTHGQAAADEVGATFAAADVSLLSDVRALADTIGARHDRLDHLVQTADVIKPGRVVTAEGLEASFATNYLSRFLLVGLLLGSVRAARGAILHVAAAGARGAALKPTEIPPGPKVGSFRAHGLGQAANDLFGLELATRLAGSGVGVHVANPGAVDTGIRDEFAAAGIGKLIVGTIGRFVTAQPAAATAQALLAAAGNHPDAVLIDRAGPVQVRGSRRNAALRQAVWARTEDVVGLRMLPVPART
jgi:NAD(P)-dependent dehydrogenase (short-subunit alcohol dehydrogenase family)